MRSLVVAAVGLALLAGSARAAGPPVLGFSISSRAATPTVASLPSATTPNAPGSISIPVSFTLPPATPQQLPLPSLYLLWQRAGSAYGIPWQVLAAINKIESNFGRNMGPSSAGAVGWMQFMPSTWLRWGVDADGDGVADPWNAADAIFAAGRYLAAAGGQTDVSRGVFAYNHADWYVREVLGLAQAYGQGGVQQAVGLDRLQAALDDARGQVVAANSALVKGLAFEARVANVSGQLHARIDAAHLLSDRLAAERRAGLFGTRLEAAHNRVESARGRLEQARSALAEAQQRAQAPSFSQGVGTLLGGPSYQSNYVFPVGGGPQVVSVGHTHHDYPAADIAAPEGSPVYALSDAVVLNAWHDPDPRCGIGVTIRTQDGQEWTYCHLASLDPSVTDGAALAAGQSIGLVGSTGHATGPHLHLQLQPTTSYPQEQPWFQSFAGRAFRWQDAPTPLLEPTEPAAPVPAPEPVFAVVPEPPIPHSRRVLGFTRGGA
jgi:murein DD-endopeptidase MepM/ murein hydrolase activator NlpD